MSIENLEIMGDIYEDGINAFEEWADFEADMATNPYDDPMFAW